MIRSPAGGVQTTEGEAVVIPFDVFEPDNDVVGYVVEYIDSSGTAHPIPATFNEARIFILKGAVFETHPKTLSRRLAWLPDLASAGTYTFRFRATDERGAAASRDVVVTVEERVGKPAIWVLRGSLMPPSGGLVSPNEIIRMKERDWFEVAIGVADPEGEKLTLEVSGLEKAQPLSYNEEFKLYFWRWQTTDFIDSTQTRHPDAGIHALLVQVTDSRGNAAEFRFTLDIAKNFNAREIVHLIPNVGIWTYIRAYGLERKVPNEFKSLKGGVSLDVYRRRSYGSERTDVDLPDLVLRYVLVAPDGPHAISPPLKGDFRYLWDTTAIPDGTYVLTVEVLDGTDIYGLQARSNQIIIDNLPGPVQGPQLVPVNGLSLDDRIDPSGPYAVDWVPFAGKVEPAPSHPYPYEFSPPATTLPDPTVLVGGDHWFVEPLVHELTGLYEARPIFYQTKEGHVYTAQYSTLGPSQLTEAVEHSERHVHYDGERNNNVVCPYSTFVPNPVGTGWVGIDLGGRIFRMNSDGSVRTIAGEFVREDVVPYWHHDPTVTTQEIEEHQETWIGDFENGVRFNMSVDLAFDPKNANNLCVTDTLNHRIAKVDFSRATPVITTFAGIPGTAGYKDGAKGEALFNQPMSLVFSRDGATLYVADRENHAIRQIDMATGMVTTLVGKGPNAPQVPSSRTLIDSASEREKVSPPSVGFDAAAIPFPQVIRMDSMGNLIVGENITRNIRRVDLQQAKVSRVISLYFDFGNWMWLDVDANAVAGPRDDILVALSTGEGVSDSGAQGNQAVLRISADGSRAKHVAPGGQYGGPLDGRPAQAWEPASHYPWGVAVDDAESRIVVIGVGTAGVASFRMARPGDPKELNASAYIAGKGNAASHQEGILTLGTARGFPRGIRPPFSFLYGDGGHSWLGTVENFDDLAGRTNVELAQFIRSGMGGTVPRPELTGWDLANLTYVIQRNTLQGNLQEIRYDEIVSDLAAAGLHDPADTRQPEIRTVQATITAPGTATITWQTDEPTIGLAPYGPTEGYYGVSSRIESRYAKDHEVILTDMTPDKRYYFRILSKDQAGNLTHHQASFDVGTPPPLLCADADRDRDVDVADVIQVIQAILGIKPDPGCQADVASPAGLTLADALKILDVALGKFKQEDLHCCGG